MKKEKLYVFVLFALVLIAIVVIATNSISAEETSNKIENSLETASDILPQNPDDATEIGREYLKQEWNKILQNSTSFGPTHRFLLAHPIFFTVIFNEPYSFSLTFICIVLLWVFILFCSVKLFSLMEWAKGFLLWASGILFSIGLAHIGLIRAIVNFALSLIYSKDMWWYRALLWIAVIMFFGIVYYFDIFLRNRIRKSMKKRNERNIKERVEELEEAEMGREEAVKE
jgi:hypothetical protein